MFFLQTTLEDVSSVVWFEREGENLQRARFRDGNFEGLKEERLTGLDCGFDVQGERQFLKRVVCVDGGGLASFIISGVAFSGAMYSLKGQMGTARQIRMDLFANMGLYASSKEQLKKDTINRTSSTIFVARPAPSPFPSPSPQHSQSHLSPPRQSSPY